MSLFTFNEDVVATFNRNGKVVADPRDMLKYGQNHKASAAKGAEEYAEQQRAKEERRQAWNAGVSKNLAKSEKEFGKQSTRALNRISNRKQEVEGLIRQGHSYKDAVRMVNEKITAAANGNGDISSAESATDAAVEAVKGCEDQSWLEKTKAKLEAKIKEYDNKFKKMEEENKKNGGSSIGNKLKWVFTKIKQLFLKLIKAIVSALASIQNKFRSKKESK